MDAITNYPKKAFSVWYSNFIKENSGYDLRKDPAFTIDSFIEKWRLTHTDIAKRIGGIRKIIEISYKKEDQEITKTKLDEILAKVEIPSYLIHDNVGEQIWKKPYSFRKDETNSCYPVKNSSIISKNLKSRVEQNKIDKLLSALGEAWANNAPKETKVLFEISCDPRDIFLLGHTKKVDEGACFRNKPTSDSGYSWQKMVIACNLNSFVIKIKDENEKIMARSWGGGVMNDECTVGFVTNSYFGNTSMISCYFDCMIQGLKEVFGEAKVYQTYGTSTLFGPTEDGTSIKVAKNGGVYFNDKEQKIIFYDKKKIDEIKEDDQEFDLAIELEKVTNGEQNRNVSEPLTCPACGRESVNRNKWDFVDGQFVCEHCVAKSNMDEIQGIRTNKEVVEVISVFGDVVKSEKSYVTKNLKKCGHTGMYAQNLVPAIGENGKKISICPDKYSITKHYTWDSTKNTYTHKKG